MMDAPDAHWASDAHDCESDGHDWVVVGEVDGVVFYRCPRCGTEDQL